MTFDIMWLFKVLLSGFHQNLCQILVRIYLFTIPVRRIFKYFSEVDLFLVSIRWSGCTCYILIIWFLFRNNKDILIKEKSNIFIYWQFEGVLLWHGHTNCFNYSKNRYNMIKCLLSIQYFFHSIFYSYTNLCR